MKLSIIVPVYNTAEFLPGCLDSVIYPEIKDYEIIIVNDGSTDNSPAIAEEYVKKYPCLIKLINTENGGLGAARNVGINNAQGEFLIFLDSDDCFAPGAIRDIYDAIDGGFDICIFDLQQTNISGDFIGVINGSDKRGQFTFAEYPELLFQPPAACNKIIRRSLFTDNNISFPGRVWYEDLRTIPKLYLHADTITSIEKKWYHYLMRPGSITNNKNIVNIVRNLEIIDAVDEILNYYRSHGVYDRHSPELEYMAFYNQFLTSCTRVNLLQWNSPVQKQLIEDYCRKFPEYKDNKYIKTMPGKFRLLEKLLSHGQFFMVHIVMKANSIMKNKKV